MGYQPTSLVLPVMFLASFGKIAKRILLWPRGTRKKMAKTLEAFLDKYEKQAFKPPKRSRAGQCLYFILANNPTLEHLGMILLSLI